MTSRINDNPSLSDLLEAHKKEIMLSFNCHHIGIVESFNADKQTVTASIAYKRTRLKRQSSGVYTEEEIKYPLLIDCPVVILRGGVASLTLPIKKGDTCLLLFNDRDIDRWFESGQLQAPATSRLHSFTDAMALVGIFHSENSLEDYDETRVALNHGDAKIAVGGTVLKKVLITSNKNLPTASLGFILDTFLTSLSGATDPTVVAAAGVAKAQLLLLLE